MPGDKKIMQSDPLAKRDDQNLGSRKDVMVSGVSSSSSGVHESSAKGGVGNGNKAAADQGDHYSSTSCYDYQYPGHNGTYSQLDGSSQMSSNGAVYSDNGSLLYYMPSYNPYATGAYMGVDGQQHKQQQQQQQQPYFSSSEAMPCYSWNSTYPENSTSFGAKSVTGSNGMKSNDFNTKRTMNFYTGKSHNYPLDMKPSQHSTPSVPKSILQSQHFRSFNKLNSAYQSGGLQKGLWNENERYKPREKSYNNGESEELTRGPRAQSLNSHIEEEKVGFSLRRDKYNLEEFQTKYDHAKFYVIKSYSEDDVHKSIKYDVWSSTPNGNKKLDAAYRDAEGKTNVFLFFSVNGSGQFVGVAEMIGSVDYEKNMDFWQLDKWNGFFPVKWHVVKDVPNTLLRHIILENNDNRPVTYTRDTQEVGLKQGLEMLEIFKSYSAKTSLLDDLSFYENREKILKAKRISKAAFQTENLKSGESNGLKDPTSSLINLTRNLSINSNTPKSSIGDKSGS
ncbi:unnamed protein product [Lactuca virosa]|uniref:YTH domain-containing family protein n=1 Tax=Lactuca virosa TaxID=75947 RepID=A0AAU9MJH2_9ASTR|nr:unnamed protein product [Lactuca virosa]